MIKKLSDFARENGLLFENINNENSVMVKVRFTNPTTAKRWEGAISRMDSNRGERIEQDIIRAITEAVSEALIIK